MGVYLPNMETPTTEQGVRTINIYADGVVTNYAEEAIGKAVPVPKHGRLIDADDAICHLFNGEQCLYSWDEIEEAIDATETIIPAEEGET